MRRTRNKVLAGLTAALGVAGAFLFLPSSAPAITGVTVTPNTGPAGTMVTVAGTCDNLLSSTARIIVSTPSAVTQSDNTLVAGAFSIDFTIPLGTPAGSYNITVDCGQVLVNVYIPLESTTQQFVVPGTVVSPPPTNPGVGGFFSDFEDFGSDPAEPITVVPRFTG
jgi:hypothetical protein